MKKPSNWVVYWFGVGLLFTAGEHIHPRSLWFLECVLVVFGLFLLKQCLDELQPARADKEVFESGEEDD